MDRADDKPDPRPDPRAAPRADRDPPVLLLDSMSLLFRSFFALPDMRTSEGVPTGGLYGLSSLLIKLLREHRPRGLAFVVDEPAPTFRHTAYEAYKATRPRAPTPLTRQLGALPRLLEAFGVPVHRRPGFEADDVLASAARQLAVVDTPALVVTGDTDLFQVARGSVAVWFVGRRQRDAKRYDEEAVRARYGIEPEQLPTYKALVGDPSDNLPGVPGVGPKTAARWILAFGSAATIVANADSLTPARLRGPVRDAGADLVLYEDLATVRAGLDVGAPLWAPFHEAARARLGRLFEEWQFRSLAPRLDALETSG